MTVPEAVANAAYQRWLDQGQSDQLCAAFHWLAADDLFDNKRVAQQVVHLIAQLAYGYWQQEQRPNGRNVEHWNRAEREVMALMAYALWELSGRHDHGTVLRWIWAERTVRDCIRLAE